MDPRARTKPGPGTRPNGEVPTGPLDHLTRLGVIPDTKGMTNILTHIAGIPVLVVVALAMARGLGRTARRP